MAKLKISGIEAVEQKLQTLASGMQGKIIREMLEAGAGELEDAWRAVIQEKRHVRTGAMMAAVARTEPVIGPDGASIEVYPQGTDSHRITNAQKAFILHYGRGPNKQSKKAIKGDKFATEAEKRAADKVRAAMEAVLDSYISGKE